MNQEEKRGNKCVNNMQERMQALFCKDNLPEMVQPHIGNRYVVDGHKRIMIVDWGVEYPIKEVIDVKKYYQGECCFPKSVLRGISLHNEMRKDRMLLDILSGEGISQENVLYYGFFVRPMQPNFKRFVYEDLAVWNFNPQEHLKDCIKEKDEKISYKLFCSCIKKCKPSILFLKGIALKQMIEVVFRKNCKDEKQKDKNVFDIWLKQNNISCHVIPYSLYEKASMEDQYFIKLEHEHGGKIPKSIKTKYARYADEKTKQFLKNELNVSGSFKLYELNDHVKKCVSSIFKYMDDLGRNVFYELNDSLIQMKNGEVSSILEKLKKTIDFVIRLREEVDRNRREIFRLMDELKDQIEFLGKLNFERRQISDEQKKHLEEARRLRNEGLQHRKMLLEETGWDEKKLNELLQDFKDRSLSYGDFPDLVRKNVKKR